MIERTRSRSAAVLLVLVLTACLGPSAPKVTTSTDGVVTYAVPLDGSDSELETLASWLGAARVVGLGEEPHGVDEFHRLGHRLFRYLARERGFRVYALEIDQAHAARLDAFVQGERDDLDALLAERWWAAIFYDQALRDLLLDLRHWNEGNAERVHVAGFDAKQPALAARAVEEQLRGLDPFAADEVRALYAEALSLGGLGIFPNVYGFTGALPIPRTSPSEGPLQVALSLRAEGVTFGRLGFSVVGKSGDVEVARQTRWLGPSDVSSLERQFEITLPLTKQIDHVDLEVFHRGNGTVWFDDLLVEFEGEAFGNLGWTSLQIEPLAMPRLQRMDYRSELDGGEVVRVPALRVRCDPSLDRALRAVRSAKELVEKALAGRGDRGIEAEWLKRQARLVEQAVEWRTLFEPNRDVFLAENLHWLADAAFPRSRVLALGHVSHTERTPRKMGGILADALGAQYATVSMNAVGGKHREFGNPRVMAPGAPLEVFPLETPKADSLAGFLSQHQTGDCAFNLESAWTSWRGRPILEGLDFREEPKTDALILLRTVHPMVPLAPNERQ